MGPPTLAAGLSILLARYECSHFTDSPLRVQPLLR
jgi:hypothetical protein